MGPTDLVRGTRSMLFGLGRIYILKLLYQLPRPSVPVNYCSHSALTTSALKNLGRKDEFV